MLLYHIVRTLILPVARRAVREITGIEHLPATGPFLIAANHIDYLDGFYVTLAAYTGGRKTLVTFLAETNNYRWTGGAIIPIDREHKAESLERAARALDAGTIIGFFIEGRRNPAAMLLPGKTGLARMVCSRRVPIVPIGIVGPSGTSTWNSIRHMLRRGSFSLHIGRPLWFDAGNGRECTREDIQHITTTVMEHLAPLCEKRAPETRPEISTL